MYVYMYVCMYVCVCVRAHCNIEVIFVRPERFNSFLKALGWNSNLRPLIYGGV
jgi:hypothetical protein